MTLADLVDLANTGGMVGMLILGIFGLWRGWIVPGRVYTRDLARERKRTQFWMRTAWVSLGLAKQNATEVPSFDFEPPAELDA